MTFEALGLHPLIQKALADIHYDKPTPVQEKAIPAGIEGKDLLVSSQTGSGKTAAFMLPALHRFASVPFEKSDKKTFNQKRQAARAKGEKVRYEPAHPKMLVLTPTRELAMQIVQSSEDYSAYLLSLIHI